VIPKFTSLNALRRAKIRGIAAKLLQDTDYLIKPKRRCWFLTRWKKSHRARLPG